MSIELSIIIPTLNEEANVLELLNRIEAALPNTNWEAIVVDDNSSDRTVEILREHAQTDTRIRCIQRIGRRGLSSACIEGFLSSSAPYCAVIDADLQHDERLLKNMLQSLRDNDALDIVVGSRYIEGGHTGDWDQKRVNISKFATKLSYLVVPKELKDPMSGFFMLKRSVVEEVVHDLSAVGFKILMDIFAASKRKLNFIELPYTFGIRTGGESKLDSGVAIEYIQLLLDKLVGHIIPVKFIIFSLIGGLGVFVHLFCFYIFKNYLNLGLFESRFVEAQTFSTIISMVFNYALNNVITFRGSSKTGLAWLGGLVVFMLACSVGAVANVGIANMFYLQNLESGWVSGWLSWFLPVVSGVLVGAVWNYAATKTLIWRQKR